MEYQVNKHFPCEVFPELIVKLIEEADKYLNCSVEYFASSILSAVSIAVGNNYRLKFKEGFSVKCNLFIALVGDPGDGKSHPLNLAFKPISKMEEMSYKKYKKMLEAFDLLDNEEGKKQTKPKYVKYILKDFTPESLVKLHSLNNKGVNIVVDELFGWINSFGRYSKNSGEQETYLSLWSGQPITVDRKGDEPIRIDDTFVGLIGTLQTKLLPKLKSDNRENNGFIERMLFALNKDAKPNLWNENEIDSSLVKNYDKFIYSLYEEKLDGDKTFFEMTLTDEAKEHLIKWQNEKRNEYFYSGLQVHTSIQAKYEVYTLRFAIILQLIYAYFNGKSRSKIDLFIIESAIKITEYFFNNAIKVHSVIHKINPIEKLTIKQKELYESLDDNFKTKNVVENSKELKIPERTAKDFLSKNINILFKKIEQGKYRKIH